MQFNIKPSQSKKVSNDKEPKQRVVKPDPFESLEDVLEDIVQHCDKMDTEMIIAEFFVAAGQVFGEMEEWPEKITQFYGQINLKFSDPESFTPIENRRNAIINKIKNKYLSLKGVNFKYRFK